MKRLGYFAVSIFMILILAACERESSEIANDSRKMELLLENEIQLLEDDNDFPKAFKPDEKFRSFLRDSVLKLNLIVENVSTEPDFRNYFSLGNDNNVTNHTNTVLKMEIIFFGNRKVMCWNRG